MIASSWIDGAPVMTAGARHQVINPQTEVWSRNWPWPSLPTSTSRLQPPVRRCPAGRGRPRLSVRVCFLLAELLAGHAADIAAEEVSQTGKPIRLATEFDVPGSIDNIAFFAGAARHLEGKATAEYSADHTSCIRREAVGVVGTITPWNYPLQMAVWKVIPALAAGCTVVIAG